MSGLSSRFAKAACHRKALALNLDGMLVPIGINPRFTDGDDFRMKRKFLNLLTDEGVRRFVHIVRMNPHRRPHMG